MVASMQGSETSPLPILSSSLPTGTTDSFLKYIQLIGHYGILSQEEEQHLVKTLQETGDIEIAKKLVVHNLRLVVKIAMGYRNTWQNLMDLIQEGNIGLMKAVSKYDLSHGARLSTYSSWWIKSYILKYILDNFHLVRIGTTNEQKKLFYNLMKEKERLVRRGIQPKPKEIAESLGVSEKSVVLMENVLDPEKGREVGIDTPLDSSSQEGRTLADILPELSEASFEDKVITGQEIEILKKHLEEFTKGLKERDLAIFQKRLLREVPLSLQQIADEYGVSRERIRQIEERLLKNLKVYMSQFIR